MLERLAKIVQKKTIDNEVHEFIKQQKVFKEKLSVTKKRIEAHRITEENRRLLQRIQEVPPVYNHTEWEAEARERENTIKNMLLYPEFYEKRLEETKYNIHTRKLPSLPNSSSSSSLYSNHDGIRNIGSSHMVRSYDFDNPSLGANNQSRLIQTAPMSSYTSSLHGYTKY